MINSGSTVSNDVHPWRSSRVAIVESVCPYYSSLCFLNTNTSMFFFLFGNISQRVWSPIRDGIVYPFFHRLNRPTGRRIQDRKKYIVNLATFFSCCLPLSFPVPKRDLCLSLKADKIGDLQDREAIIVNRRRRPNDAMRSQKGPLNWGWWKK